MHEFTQFDSWRDGCVEKLVMERKMKSVVQKFSSHKEAEEWDDSKLFITSGEERFEEWSKLFNNYCKSINIKIEEGRAIIKQVKKLSANAI